MIKKLIKNEKGATIVLCALLLPILIGFIGLSIDGGNMLYQKTKLIEATEAAGRSTILMSYNKDIWLEDGKVVINLDLARTNAEIVFKKNYNLGKIDEVLVKDENKLIISSSVLVKYTFMKLFGYSENKLECSRTYSGG